MSAGNGNTILHSDTIKSGLTGGFAPTIQQADAPAVVSAQRSTGNRQQSDPRHRNLRHGLDAVRHRMHRHGGSVTDYSIAYPDLPRSFTRNPEASGYIVWPKETTATIYNTGLKSQRRMRSWTRVLRDGCTLPLPMEWLRTNPCVPRGRLGSSVGCATRFAPQRNRQRQMNPLSSEPSGILGRELPIILTRQNFSGRS